MISVVLDIDDTLIVTGKRMQAVWSELLGIEVPLADIETKSLEEIFMKYATPDQRSRVYKFQKRFWDIVLCLEEYGIELLKLDEAMPFAADILQTWIKKCSVTYLTGRTENTRDLTLAELKKFGFPIERTELVMFNVEDYGRTRGINPLGPTLTDTKERLLASICKKKNVIRVVDDHPGYFAAYRKFEIPDRIGFLSGRRYTPQVFIDQGATRTIESWKQLENDPPEDIWSADQDGLT